MKASKIIGAGLGIGAAAVLGEIIYKTAQTPIPDLPEKVKDGSLFEGGKDSEFVNVYYSLLNGDEISESEVYRILKFQTDYVDRRFDCADFRLQLLFRIYKDCGSALSDRAKQLIKKTFLNFKYFMDEPGDDSMCYWSENHQIEFAVSEYLAGQEWGDEIFANDGFTGEYHRVKASHRIEAWMKQRFDFGFSEYLSNNYLLEDIGPMSNYISYCLDRKSAERMKIVMDILWLDVALNSVNNRFSAASSRMYGDNKAGNFYGNSVLTCMNKIWGERNLEALKNLPEKEKRLIENSFSLVPGSMEVNFISLIDSGEYAVPEIISDIALSRESFAVKMHSGLSPEDMEREKLIGQAPEQIMAQLGAESFTNPEVIENTVKYVKANRMHRNLFIYYFKYLDTLLLKRLNLKKIAEKHELMMHGIALGDANIYTYRTADYAMTTLVAKDVDRCGAQEHIWNANIAENLTLFTTHPAKTDEKSFGSSPGYWIGNGRRPMSVQQENVNITIYKLPTKRRLPEIKISDMTHAYFPKCFYDETEHCGNIIFGRRNNVFVALIGNGEMQFKPYNEAAAKPFYKTYDSKIQDGAYMITGEFDLCRQGGEYHSYITELSDSGKESFEDFKARILSNPVSFNGSSVTYKSLCGELYADYCGVYLLNGVRAETEFKRYDCKFCTAERKPEKIAIGGKWTLDFVNAVRKANG